VAVAIGAVAEPAGVAVIVAEAIDGERVRLEGGRVVSCDDLARELA
jgi:hypothetical protein